LLVKDLLMSRKKSLWFILLVSLHIYVHCRDEHSDELRPQEYVILCDLAYATNLNSLRNWTCTDEVPDANPCGWFGIMCGAMGNVIDMRLSGTAILGTLPPSFGSLKTLTYLEITNTNIHGDLPWTLGFLASLEVLDFSHNMIGGSIPSALGQLTSLSIISLAGNTLTGPVPAELGGMTNIKVFDIHSNMLSGSIPEAFAQLMTLVEFRASDNLFELKQFPVAMCSFVNLTAFHLTQSTENECLVSAAPNRTLTSVHEMASGPTLPERRRLFTAPSMSPAGLFYCNQVSQEVVGGIATFGNSNGVGTNAKFNFPSGMFTSLDGSYVLIADHSNHMIRKMIVSTSAVSTFAGRSSAGNGNGVGTNAYFDGPHDIAISSDGSFAVSVCQTGHHIRHVVISTAQVTSLAGIGPGSSNGVGTNARFNFPTGMTLSSTDAFVLIVDKDNHLIRKVVLSSKVVTRVAGSGTNGGANGIGTSAAFAYPTFMALSSDDGFALISEFGNRLRKLVLSTLVVTTVAGSPSSTSGSADGVGTSATFYQPYAVRLSSDDQTAYVVERGNNQVRRVALSTRQVSTLTPVGGSVALGGPTGITWLSVDSWLLVGSFDGNRVFQMYGTCPVPTTAPTPVPTFVPTKSPTFAPTKSPTFAPTKSPTFAPPNRQHLPLPQCQHLHRPNRLHLRQPQCQHLPPPQCQHLHRPNRQHLHPLNRQRLRLPQCQHVRLP
jgi:hypothetical protein